MNRPLAMTLALCTAISLGACGDGSTAADGPGDAAQDVAGGDAAQEVAGDGGDVSDGADEEIAGDAHDGETPGETTGDVPADAIEPPDSAMDVSVDVAQDTLCDGFAACEEAVTSGCQAVAVGGEAWACERACLEAMTTCEEAATCLPVSTPDLAPFDGGPSGVQPRDLAGDFTLPTLAGDFVFSEAWNGRDSYLFLLTQQAFSYSVDLWASSVYYWLQQSPQNIHVFFMSYQEADGTDMAQDVVSQMRDQIEEGIDKISLVYGPGAGCMWKRRIHYVPVIAWDVGGWIPEHLQVQSGYGFAIDRFQKIRNVGMLHILGGGDAQPQLSHLRYENQHFDFEYEREQTLAKEGVTEVVVLDEVQTGGGFYDVALPDGLTMATFDTMELDLTSHCPGHFEGSGCPEWDYKAWIELREIPDENLDAQTPCQPTVSEVAAAEEMLGECHNDGVAQGETCVSAEACTGEGALSCEGYQAPVTGVTGIAASTLACSCYAYDGAARESAQTCNNEGTGYGDCSCGESWEFGRWITSYAREGRWVHDVSPMLAFFQTGGLKRVRYKAGNSYLTTLKFRFSNQGKGMRPVRATRLFGGGGYANSYNNKYEPLPVNIQAGVKRVEVVAHITGHGFGSEAANCAEFCNHTHHFGVNDSEFVKDHPEADWMYGCAMQVPDGALPNQFGTWYLGRGGWCPGMEVDPFVADVTQAIVPGEENILTYKSLLDGEDYVAQPGPGGGFGSNIWMSSWLIEWE
jgi:hypothetical protein